MKQLKYLALAALVALGACDEGEGLVETPTVEGTITGTVQIDGAGAQGVTVTLAGATSQTATTSASGQYTFSNVPAGAYSVTISGYPADVTFSATSKAAVVAAANQTVVVDFAGMSVQTAAITGQVTAGGQGVAGVTVSLSGPESATTATNVNGAYSFTGLRAGTYTVAISDTPAGYNFATTSKSVTVTAGQTQVASFAGSAESTAVVQGSVSIDGADAAGIVVTLAGDGTAVDTTDANGDYSFSALGLGVYSITISGYPADVAFDAVSKSALVDQVGETVTVNFTGNTIAGSQIYGNVTSQGSGIAGVTVTLSGAASRVDTTDANGSYSFPGLTAGTYTVTISNTPNDVSFSTTSQTVTIGSNEARAVSFTGAPAATGTISGSLFIDENPKNDTFEPTAEGLVAVAGVEIVLEGPQIGTFDTTATDAQGKFSFDSLPAGEYRVTIDSNDANIPGYLVYGLASETRSVTLAANGNQTVNFPFDIEEQTVTIDAVLAAYNDDAGAPPVPGVGLGLYPTQADAVASTNRLDRDTTDASGQAQFTFDRSDDYGPGGAATATDYVVFAKVLSTPTGYAVSGPSIIEIRIDRSDELTDSGDDFNLLTSQVVLGMQALGNDTTTALAGWEAALYTDTTIASVQRRLSDANGWIYFPVNPATVGQNYYMILTPPASQPGTAGADNLWTQMPNAQEGSKAGRYLRFQFQGVTPMSDTVDVGDEIVTFQQTDILARVFHEANDTLKYQTAGPGPDDLVNVAAVNVTLRRLNADGTPGPVVSTKAANPANGLVTWDNVPTGANYFMYATSTDATYRVLKPDTIQITDLNGQELINNVCPLGVETNAGCGTFMTKYQNNRVSGRVRDSQGNNLQGVRVVVSAHPNTIQPARADTSVFTNVNGVFVTRFNMREGDYIVTPVDTLGWEFRGANDADTVNISGSAQDVATQIFVATATNTAVQGVVVNDRDQDITTIDPGEALAGVTIRLYAAGPGSATNNVGTVADSLVGETTTDSNGAYAFSGLLERRYIVKADYVGSAAVLRALRVNGTKVDTVHVRTGPNPANGTNFSMRVGTTSPTALPRWDYNNADAINENPSHFTFLYSSGAARVTVRNGGGDPVPNMTVTLRRCHTENTAANGTAQPSFDAGCDTYVTGTLINATTNASGQWTFPGLEEGFWEISANPGTAGYATSNGPVVYPIVGANDLEEATITVN